MSTKKIEFIGIGAPKSGTSWLWEMLRQHPDIFIPEKKELHYFNIEAMGDSKYQNPNYSKPFEYYLEHFEKATANQICGEITPAYLVSRTAPKKISELCSDVKLIAILRNPIERSYSDFLYRKQMGWISPKTSFEIACKQHPEILTCSEYASDLKRYFEFFSKENILILFHDDLIKSPEQLLLNVEIFLRVKEFVPENLLMRSNETGNAKYPLLNRTSALAQNFLRRLHFQHVLTFIKASWLGKILQRSIYQTTPAQNKQRISAEERSQLLRYFNDDIAELELLTNRNLGNWKADAVK